MQRGNQVVVAVAFVIKAGAAFPADFLQQFCGQNTFAVSTGFGHIRHHFQHIQRTAGITGDQFGQQFTGLIRQDDILSAQSALRIIQRLNQNRFDIFR